MKRAETVEPVAFPLYYVRVTSGDHEGRYVGDKRMAGGIPLANTDFFTWGEERPFKFFERRALQLQATLRKAGHLSEVVSVTSSKLIEPAEATGRKEN
jgi:hypothetical protein